MWYLVHGQKHWSTLSDLGRPCKLKFQWLELFVRRLLQVTVSSANVISHSTEWLLEWSSQEAGHIWLQSSIFNSTRKEQMSNIPPNPRLTWWNAAVTVESVQSDVLTWSSYKSRSVNGKENRTQMCSSSSCSTTMCGGKSKITLHLC